MLGSSNSCPVLALDTHRSIKGLVEEEGYTVEQAEKIVYFLLGDETMEF